MPRFPPPPGDRSVTAYSRRAWRWSARRRRYRFGVLLIYLPEPLRSAVDRLRRRYALDAQRSCEAHITLTVPATGPVSRRQWAALAAAAAAAEPVEVTCGPLATFLPHPVVYLAVRPEGALDALRRSFERVAPFSGAPPRRYPFCPHVTIAQGGPAARARVLAEALAPGAPGGRFLCREVAYAVPDDAFHFSERGLLRLGPAAARGRRAEGGEEWPS